MTALEHKTSLAVTIKSADKGEARVRFSTPDGMTPDKDQDVTGPVAFTEGAQVVVSPFGHRSVWDGAIPAGRATIHRDGTADLNFFLDTPTGHETFSTVKGLGSIVQYSYGFHIREEGELTPAMRAAGARRYLKRLDVIELSPVVEGAGLNTGTLALKACGCGAGSTCGCTKAQPSRVKLAQSMKLFERNQAMLACLKEPRGYGVLAMQATEAAVRWLTNGRQHEAPPVKLFDADGRRAGYWQPGEDCIHVSRGLSPDDLIRTCGHEVGHWMRPWDADGEALARQDGQMVLRRFRQSLADGGVP